VPKAKPRLLSALSFSKLSWVPKKGKSLGKSEAESHTRPGKLSHNYGKSPFFMGKSTISTGPFSIISYVYQRLFLLTMNDFFVELHGFSDIGPMFVIELTKKYAAIRGSNEPRVRRWDVHPLLSHILWVSENWGYSKKKC